MPAEKIHSIGLPGDSDLPHLRVSWGPECGYLQVASLFEPKHGADVIISTVNEWLKGAGLADIPGREELSRLITKMSAPDSIVAQFGIGFDGFHVTLDDRRSINQLIAVARRARDSAFGRDE